MCSGVATSEIPPRPIGSGRVWTFLRLRGEKHGQFALIDAADHPWVSQYKWYATKRGDISRNGYGRGGQRIALHRELLGDPMGEIDHVNRRRWDNRRCNLRVVTRHQQMQNLPSHRDAGSPHRGVSRCAQTGRWAARVTINRKSHWLGRFDTEEAAAAAAQDFRAKHMPFAVD